MSGNGTLRKRHNLNDIKGYNESDYKVTIDGVEDFFDVIILSNITTGNGLFTGYSTEGYADDETNYSNNGIFNHETQLELYQLRF